MAAYGKDLVASSARHVRLMLEKAPGPKVLLLDAETTGIVACAMTQSEILQKEVFLVDRLDALPSGEFEYMNIVCFVRPTNENVLLLMQLLHQEQEESDDPEEGPRVCARRFKEVHIFFTAQLQRQSEMLKRLARQDEGDLVAQVFELYVDIFPLGPRLFTLNIPAVSQLLFQDHSLWTAYDESLFERMVDGVFSCIALLGVGPLIRYQKGSKVCQRFADTLQHRLEKAQAQGPALAEGWGRLVLLLFDRREDPVTPLLNQWTYSAMVHELLGIRLNRVDLSKVPNISDDLKEVVLSTTQDEFYKANCVANFGDLGVAVKQHINEYQKKTKTHAQIASLEALRNFLDEYPECQKLSGFVSKHVAIVHELSRLVQQRQLLRVSELEQDLAVRESRVEHLKAVLEFLQDTGVTTMDKLRLVALYAIRYEGDASIKTLKEELKRVGVEAEEAVLVDAITQYSSADRRSGDLLQNKNFLAVARNSITKGLQGVTNVYTQHRSLLHSVVDSLIKGKLRESTYPVMQAHYYSSSSAVPPREKLQTVVVFVVGGATYEEERDMEELSRSSGIPVILGGSTILNSRSFLADVSQVIRGHALSAIVPVPACCRP